MCGALLWIYRLPLLSSLVLGLLERRGLGPAHLVLDRIDGQRLNAHDVDLYGGALRAGELSLSFTPGQVLAGHLSELTVTGLRILLSGEEPTLGGAPLRASPSATGSAPLGGVRIDAVRIDDARIAWDRPGGRLEVTFSTRLVLAGAELRAAALAVDASVPVAGGRRALRLVVPELALSLPEPGGLRLEFAGAEIAPEALPWTASGLGGELVWRAGVATAKLSVDRLIQLGQPALVVPLRLAGEVAMAGSALDFALHAQAEAAGARGRLELDVVGSHDLASGSGQATLAAPPVVFAPQGLQPAQLFPRLAGRLPDLAGAVAVSGALRWQGLALSPDLVVRLGELAFDSPGARFRRIRGDVRLDGLGPLRTPPGQSLAAVVEAGGLPPSDVTLGFQLLPKPVLRVESLRARFAGGRISASRFDLDPAAPRLDTVLKVEQVDLAEILTLVGIDGLSGTGRLDGQLPLRSVGGRLRIEGGALAASGPGILHFRREPLARELAGAGEDVNVALEALRDFHYETLSLAIDESAAGQGTVRLTLQGNNPAYLEGRRFHFNIALESNFDRLRELALQGMTAAQMLLRRSAGGLRP